MRTFIAANLPDTIRSELSEHLDRFRPLASGVSWIPPGNAHITLKFLGDVPESELGGVSAAVKDAVTGYKQFAVQLGGFGAFPNFRRPRVFWVGIVDGTDVLRGLARSIDKRLRPLGFEREKRKFSAHITLGRIRRPGTYDDLRDAAEDTQYISQPFTVPSVEIMKSVLTPQGARYSVFESFPLET